MILFNDLPGMEGLGLLLLVILLEKYSVLLFGFGSLERQ
jgi:hypothetical protein